MATRKVNFLQGQRFPDEARDTFRMTTEEFETLDFESEAFVEVLEELINEHRSKHLPRLEELKRYYNTNNNIKYRETDKDEFEPDNRIASDFAKFITTFKQGELLGKPIEYENESEELTELIGEFNKQNNMGYHDMKLFVDTLIYGRAYELTVVRENPNYVEPSWVEKILSYQNPHDRIQLKVYKLKPEETFVVYDDAHEQNSLFGVNYYSVGKGSRKSMKAVVYAHDEIHYYGNSNALDSKAYGLKHTDREDHFFNGVSITEVLRDEEKNSVFESVLDTIDAYDLSQSELANFQQYANEANLMLTGVPYTGQDEQTFDEEGNLNPNSRLGIARGFKKSHIIILDGEGDQKPDAKYLVKEYDVSGSETYKDRLVGDILRFTFTPDLSDENFAGTQSGQAMEWKMMGSSNQRVTSEELFKKAVMRRLRLAANVWQIRGNSGVDYDTVNETSIIFTPNMPKNDKEIIENVKSMDGIVSDETKLTILEKVTGVKAKDEMERIEQEENSGKDFTDAEKAQFDQMREDLFGEQAEDEPEASTKVVDDNGD